MPRCLKITRRPSPNYEDRRGGEHPWMIVIHYTGMRTGQAALDRLCDPQARVSAHYMIEETGEIFALVEEAHRAWHAGTAQWKGETDVNSVSIGIELVNPGHEWGYRAFPEAQIDALIVLIRAIRSRHGIAPEDIVGHEDVAPGRKQDPGDLFPWDQVRGRISEVGGRTG